MISAGEHAGKRTLAILTSMDQPLGQQVGNWVETWYSPHRVVFQRFSDTPISEAVECLQGKGPADLRAIVLAFAAHMYLLGNPTKTLPEAYKTAQAHLDEGKVTMCLSVKLVSQKDQALSKFRQMVRAQGGDLSYIDNPSKFPSPAFSAQVWSREELCRLVTIL